MQTIEFFQQNIDKLILDKEYYRKELLRVLDGIRDPETVRFNKMRYQKLIAECEKNIIHYKQGIIAVKNINLEVA